MYVMWWVLYTLKAPLYLNLYFTSCTYLGKTQKKLPVGTQCNMMYHECHVSSQLESQSTELRACDIFIVLTSGLANFSVALWFLPLFPLSPCSLPLLFSFLPPMLWHQCIPPTTNSKHRHPSPCNRRTKSNRPVCIHFSTDGLYLLSTHVQHRSYTKTNTNPKQKTINKNKTESVKTPRNNPAHTIAHHHCTPPLHTTTTPTTTTPTTTTPTTTYLDSKGSSMDRRACLFQPNNLLFSSFNTVSSDTMDTTWRRQSNSKA